MFAEPKAVGDELVDLLLSRPSLEEIVNFRLSDAMEQRVSALLDANRAGIISQDEQEELDNYLVFEHAVRRAKIRAYERLKQEQYGARS